MQNVTDYEISRSKHGVKIWTDTTETFKKLPVFLNGQYFFRTPTKGNKNKSWTIQVHGPSTIYVATKGKTKPIGKRSVDPTIGQQNGVDGEKKNEITNGWFKQEGSVVTSSNVDFANILGKNLESKNINRITLQPIKSDEDRKIIFISGNNRYILVFVSTKVKFFTCLFYEIFNYFI